MPKDESSQSRNTIYKVVHHDAWQLAKSSGVFLGAPIDFEDGFIHFSAADQLEDTIEKHFRGQTDLVLVAVDATRLGDKLKWEVSRGGQDFPHLYDQLMLSNVLWTATLD